MFVETNNVYHLLVRPLGLCLILAIIHVCSPTLKPLDSVYHSALHFITADKFLTHHCILLEKVTWSSLTNRENRSVIYQLLFLFHSL